jgi:hypothetical protein
MSDDKSRNLNITAVQASGDNVGAVVSAEQNIPPGYYVDEPSVFTTMMGGEEGDADIAPPTYDDNNFVVDNGGQTNWPGIEHPPVYDGGQTNWPGIEHPPAYTTMAGGEEGEPIDTTQALGETGEPPIVGTTMALGEEGEPIDTTQALGETGEPPIVGTTLALGEEGEPIDTTQALGETGEPPIVGTTMALGEEGEPIDTTQAIGETGEPPILDTTMALGEEGEPIDTTQAVGENGEPPILDTTMALGEEGEPIDTTQAVGETGEPPILNTTMALGEEGDIDVTTMMGGEEGDAVEPSPSEEKPPVTTQAGGEEGEPGEDNEVSVTMMVGENGDIDVLDHDDPRFYLEPETVDVLDHDDPRFYLDPDQPNDWCGTTDDVVPKRPDDWCGTPPVEDPKSYEKFTEFLVGQVNKLLPGIYADVKAALYEEYGNDMYDNYEQLFTDHILRNFEKVYNEIKADFYNVDIEVAEPEPFCDLPLPEPQELPVCDLPGPYVQLEVADILSFDGRDGDVLNTLLGAAESSGNQQQVGSVEAQSGGAFSDLQQQALEPPITTDIV